MSARAAAAALALGLGGCAPSSPAPAAKPEAAVEAAVDRASPAGAALAQACAGREGWGDPAPPARIFGNVHYVGTCGITALLVTSPRGHVLIDGAVPEAAAGIVQNIRRLGFDPRQVVYLLNSHEHVDHAGGLAELKRLTGARLLARAEARRVLETGMVDASDPQSGSIPGFPGVPVDAVLTDGQKVQVGPLTLTTHATNGHTAGSTSWSWRSCQGADCRTIVYADSLSAVAPASYRFARHPALVARFRATFGAVERLDCDILITPHPRASNLFERLAGRAPLADPGACVRYAADARRRLDERLAREAAS